MSEPPLFDLLDWDQLSNADDESYLLVVEQLVSQVRGKHYVVERRSGSVFKLRIEGIDHSKENDEKMDDWGIFYLPQLVKMCVFGVEDVLFTPNTHKPTVLMTCEDRKVYGYDGKDLHEVASNLKDLCFKGLEYPASVRYPMGTFNYTGICPGMTPQETFLVCQDPFRYNAVMIIRYMLYWAEDNPESKHLVDEVIHSIFFFGEITVPKYEPKDIFDDEMLTMLKGQYPRPLECYRTHVPKRSPFSCVLDMIVLRLKETQRIKDCLKTLSKSLRSDPLTSTAMCVTTYKGCNYYGVSMPKKLKTKTNCYAAEIMIAASCLSSWDEYVAGAVMTYYPQRTDFDGTIQLPDSVTCETFTIRSLKEKKACTHCRDLFGLFTMATKTAPWKHGNCAEAESVSNLFKNQNAVKEEARPTSTTYTAENLNQVKRRVHEKLRNHLSEINFHLQFYEPQIH